MSSEHGTLSPDLARTAARQLEADRVRRKHGRGWLVRRMLAGADVLALCASFALTELLFAHATEQRFEVGVGEESLIFLATLPLWILGAQIYGLYDRDDERAYHSTVDEFVSVFHLVTVCVFGFFALSWLTGLTDPSQQKLATFWVLTVLGRTTARSGACADASRLRPYS